MSSSLKLQQATHALAAGLKLAQAERDDVVQRVRGPVECLSQALPGLSQRKVE